MKKYIVKQEDSTDCGACVLLSIIKYYKGYVPLEVIKVDTFTTETGTNFYYLKQASEKYGFNVIGKKNKELNNLTLPCIAQLNINNFHHFIAIFKINDKVTFMDPSKGIVILPLKEFNELFTGYILELIPAGKIIKYEDNKSFKKLLIMIYKTHFKTIIILFILALVVVSLFLISGLNPWFLKNKQLIPLVIILSFSKILMLYIKNNLMSHLNKKINITLFKNYFKQIFNLPLKYLQLKKTGDFVNRINDLENIKNLFSKTILDILINGFLFILGLIFLFILEVKLTIILLIITFIYVSILLKINKKAYYKIILNIESDNNLMDKIIEYLNNIKTVKTNPQEYFKNYLDLLINDSGNKKFFLDKIINLFELIKNSLEELMMIIILIYYYHYGLDLSLILIYLSVYSFYLGAIKYYLDLFPLIMYFKDVIYRIKSIYDISSDQPKFKISYNQNLYLQNITYSVNKFQPIFKNFNLKIKTGNKVLIKGPNGCGKTTLLDIIYGSITDYEGNVIKSRNISYINQKSKIFSGTILENVILNEEYNLQKLSKISEILLLDKFFKNKPNGYYSRVSSLTNLSGGESQKIILARGLYQNFDILLLDESLSEISKVDREIILKNIFKYYPDKIIICVNHYIDQIKYNQVIDLTARKRGIC